MKTIELKKEQERYQSGVTYRKMEIRKKLKFEIHVAEHCNLNCKYCNHFSPLAREEFLSLEEYESDLARLSLLFHGEMQQIKLLGGEPLLHPQIDALMLMTRRYFPEGIIKILTNGTLLLKKSDAFWQVCHETGTVIMYSKYPIPYDEEGIRKQAGRFQVALEIADEEERIEYGDKKMMYEPIDIEGKQDAVKNFYACVRPNYCITLKHGKMYTCNRAAHMHLLKDYFKFDIPLDERNGIDIYKAESAQEILDYMVKPIPMCAYCDMEHTTTGHEWGVSKKEKSEFISIQK